MTNHQRKWVAGILVALLSGGLLFVLLSQIKLDDLHRLASRFTPAQLAGVFALYAGANLFRAIRLRSVLGENHLLSLTSISGLHAFLNHVLPFRSGELSLPFLLKACLGRNLANGAVALVIVRLYDTLSITLLMLFSLAMVHSEIEAHLAATLGYALTAVAGGVIATFAALPLILRVAGKWVPACGAALGSRGVHWGARLAEALHTMHHHLSGLTPVQRYLTLPVTSLLVQLCIYGFFYYAMRFMGIDIGFCTNMLASSGEMITSLLPINMIGSLGTLEAGWAIGYAICGIPRVDAIATGFIVHGLIIGSGLLISLAGLLQLSPFLLSSRRNSGGASQSQS